MIHQPPPLRLVSRRALLIGGATAATSVASLGLGVACAPETSGGRVLLPAFIGARSTQAVDTAYGWRVTLTRAELHFAGLALLQGAALGASLRQLLATPPAYAHPGHYQGGAVLAEVLRPQRVNLLAGETPLGDLEGVEGTPHSAALHLGGTASSAGAGGGGAEGRGTFEASAVGAAGAGGVGGAPGGPPSASSAGPRVATLQGRGERDGVRCCFEAALQAGDFAAEDALLVEGCASRGDLAPGQRLSVQVDLALWLSQLDLSGVALGSSDAPTPLAPSDRAHKGLTRGLQKAAAYDFTLSKVSP